MCRTHILLLFVFIKHLKIIKFYLTFVKNIQKLTHIFLVLQIFIFLGSLYSLLKEIKRVREHCALAIT